MTLDTLTRFGKALYADYYLLPAEKGGAGIPVGQPLIKN